MSAVVEEEPKQADVNFVVDRDTVFRNVVADIDLPLRSVVSTVVLLEDDATVPFIARYRKERTGGLDETQIRGIADKWQYYLELEKRKEFVLKTIKVQDKLTDELRASVIACKDKQKLEDIYLPFKPKRRTKATIAKEKGLEPLAELIMKQEIEAGTPEDICAPFINEEKGVKSVDDALAGAIDIMTENIADNASIRGWLRALLENHGILSTKVRKEFEDEKTKFEMYYNFSEPLCDSPSHRLLAIRRGANEKVLSWEISIEEAEGLDFVEGKIITNSVCIFYDQVKKACKAAFRRIMLALETEVFVNAMQRAEEEAFGVFSKNLRNLLLDAPAGQHVIMGVDPGFRTGCKVCVIDESGDFKEFEAVYPNAPQNEQAEAAEVIMKFIRMYDVKLVAIGNGTASRETESFVRFIVKKSKLPVKVVMVSEAGASVYSASETAIREFPKLDVTVRGAISIARRLQDPLAELVKIDPKSIGVGQYQHDVNQNKLKKELVGVVESCVNYVGVEVNTASSELMSYVSGIGPVLAENIVKHRSEKGVFYSRKDLLDVKKLGAKAYEQCAGFLRIRISDNPLDNSAIHPERYEVVERMAADLGKSIDQLIGNPNLVSKINLEKYVTDDLGLMTLQDIADELKKPGLDPRDEFTSIEFKEGVDEITDLKEDMELVGKVTNVTNFGAFVDIGVHQDGLIHISKLSNRFVNDPHEVVSVGDKVRVKVLDVDLDLKRISLARLC